MLALPSLSFLELPTITIITILLVLLFTSHIRSTVPFQFAVNVSLVAPAAPDIYKLGVLSRNGTGSNVYSLMTSQSITVLAKDAVMPRGGGYALRYNLLNRYEVCIEKLYAFGLCFSLVSLRFSFICSHLLVCETDQVCSCMSFSRFSLPHFRTCFVAFPTMFSS